MIRVIKKPVSEAIARVRYYLNTLEDRFVEPEFNDETWPHVFGTENVLTYVSHYPSEAIPFNNINPGDVDHLKGLLRKVLTDLQKVDCKYPMSNVVYECWSLEAEPSDPFENYLRELISRETLMRRSALCYSNRTVTKDATEYTLSLMKLFDYGTSLWESPLDETSKRFLVCQPYVQMESAREHMSIYVYGEVFTIVGEAHKSGGEVRYRFYPDWQDRLSKDGYNSDLIQKIKDKHC